MNKIETLFKEWQSLQPVKEEYQQRLDQKFMLEFNYNSNHIEGNTLTYGFTKKRICNPCWNKKGRKKNCKSGIYHPEMW